jgi:hypothetical protein
MAIAEKAMNECINSCRRFVIERGNKRLTLGINTVTGVADEIIMNIPGLPRTAGSTTRVHIEAKNLMQATANELGMPIRYELSVFSPFSKKMVEWALDPEKGKAVFEWDIVHKPCFFIPLLTAIKTFYPQKTASETE